MAHIYIIVMEIIKERIEDIKQTTTGEIKEVDQIANGEVKKEILEVIKEESAIMQDVNLSSDKVSTDKVLTDTSEPESTKLEWVKYTDKSIVVFGATKLWKNKLKELNGRFNSKLKTAPYVGYIFPLTKLDMVKKFVENVNNGAITQSTQISPRYVKENYTPNTDNGRIDIPDIGHSVTGYANRFIGGDGLKYQIIITTAVLPYNGQKFEIDYLDKHPKNGIVTNAYSANGCIEYFEALVGNDKITLNIICGVWQVLHEPRQHNITFSK